MNSIRDKYRDVLVSNDGLSVKRSTSLTSGQANLKKSLAGRFAHRSERQIDRALKNEFAIKPEKRKKLIEDIKGGGKLTKHEVVQLKKEFERVKNRNRALSRNDRDKFAAVMGDEEFRPRKSQQISALRGRMKEGEKVKDTAQSRLGVNYRKDVQSFAGSKSRSDSSSSTASKLGGDKPMGLTGGVGSNTGGGGIKFVA